MEHNANHVKLLVDKIITITSSRIDDLTFTDLVILSHTHAEFVQLAPRFFQRCKLDELTTSIESAFYENTALDNLLSGVNDFYVKVTNSFNSAITNVVESLSMEYTPTPVPSSRYLELIKYCRESLNIDVMVCGPLAIEDHEARLVTLYAAKWTSTPTEHNNA